MPSDTFIVDIPGDSDTAIITSEIADEELSFCKFVRASIGTHEGKMTNLATFLELANGEVPKTPVLLEADEPPPAGKQQVWSGVMLISGVATQVNLYR